VAAGSQTVADTRRTPASAEIQALLMEQFAAVLQITADHLDLDAPFSDFGVDSILSVALIRRLNRALSIELRTTDLFNYPSIRQLAEHVLDQFGDSLVIGGDDNNEDVSAVPDASLSDILDRWLISGVLDIEEAERRIMGVINEG
jgi:acyl carrier protein